MKPNESEVGNDMLLVLDYFYTSNVCQSNLKQDTCDPYNISVYTEHVYWIYVTSIMYLRLRQHRNVDKYNF